MATYLAQMCILFMLRGGMGMSNGNVSPQHIYCHSLEQLPPLAQCRLELLAREGKKISVYRPVINMIDTHTYLCSHCLV